MDQRKESIHRHLMHVVGGYDDLTVAELLRAMANETSPGEAWTVTDLRRLANLFWRED